jgi:hypothetical protein
MIVIFTYGNTVRDAPCRGSGPPAQPTMENPLALLGKRQEFDMSGGPSGTPQRIFSRVDAPLKCVALNLLPSAKLGTSADESPYNRFFPLAHKSVHSILASVVRLGPTRSLCQDACVES